jgi:hypothetical protein
VAGGYFVAPVVGVSVGFPCDVGDAEAEGDGEGDGDGAGAATDKVAVTVTGLPIEGMIATVAIYFPGVSPVGSTVKVRGVLWLAASLPLVGLTASQPAVGFPTCHDNVPPPLFVTVIT